MKFNATRNTDRSFVQILTRNNRYELRAPVRGRAPQLANASARTRHRRHISCASALRMAKTHGRSLAKAEVKATGGSRCRAPRCRVHTRPSSQRQEGEDGGEVCQRSFAATLGLSYPYTRSRHSRGPTTKADNSAGVNVQTVLGTSEDHRGESTSSLHGDRI